MSRLSAFALASVLSLGTGVSAAHAGIADIEHLGSGGLCNKGETSTGMIKTGDKTVITPGSISSDCNKLYDLIDKLRSKEINSEERINNKLINSQHTVGMINSIGSIAAPLLSGLMANSQARAQAAPPVADNSQYLQVIQQQQQQIDELRQLMTQNQAPSYNSDYMTVGSQGQQGYRQLPAYRNRLSRSSSLRQVNLF